MRQVGEAADQVLVVERQLNRQAVGDGLKEVALRLQRLLGGLAFGDVHQRVVGAQEAALVVQHSGGVEQADEAGAIAPQHADLGGLQRLAAQQALQRLHAGQAGAQLLQVGAGAQRHDQVDGAGGIKPGRLVVAR